MNAQTCARKGNVHSQPLPGTAALQVSLTVPLWLTGDFGPGWGLGEVSGSTPKSMVLYPKFGFESHYHMINHIFIPLNTTSLNEIKFFAIPLWTELSQKWSQSSAQLSGTPRWLRLLFSRAWAAGDGTARASTALTQHKLSSICSRIVEHFQCFSSGEIHQSSKTQQLNINKKWFIFTVNSVESCLIPQPSITEFQICPSTSWWTL